MRRLMLIASLLLANMALANAPGTSLRPVAREDVFPVAIRGFGPVQSLRPVIRPGSGANVLPSYVVPAPQPTVYTGTGLAPLVSARPLQRPAHRRFGVRKASTTPSKPSKKSARGVGRVCGDRQLQGEFVGNVPGKLRGCGATDAVRLHSVSGVTLSNPAVMECQTAKALKKWVDRGVEPAIGRHGGGLAKLNVAAGYSCRTRNSKPGAKISEHGKGHAIDISGFTLANGERISVLNDWGRSKRGRMLKKMHGSACGTFGTVLGPNADRYHRDHFHLDVARHRSGAYCR